MHVKFTPGPCSPATFRRSTSAANFNSTPATITPPQANWWLHLFPKKPRDRIDITTITMAQSATPQIRSLYRRLLRELPSTPQTTRTRHQKLSSPSLLQKSIRTSIATPKTGSSTQGQIQQAEQFVQYVQAQRTYASLLERYNPGMGMTEEERVRLSARRVGMNLPVEFSQDGEKA